MVPTIRAIACTTRSSRCSLVAIAFESIVEREKSIFNLGLLSILDCVVTSAPLRTADHVQGGKIPNHLGLEYFLSTDHVRILCHEQFTP